MPRTVRREPRCAGVDGCRAGWVVTSRDGVRVESSLATVLAHFDVVGIDMPIGLPIDQPRHSDLEARRYLSPRGSTVFATPPRACIDATDYGNACALARLATGKAISLQAWNITPKIREVDALVAPDLEDRVAEVHPECSFMAMNGERPLASKHTEDGREHRAQLTRHWFGLVPQAPRGARVDDVLDAYAVLWSTERFARGEHRTMPSSLEQRDRRGLIMRIVV